MDEKPLPQGTEGVNSITVEPAVDSKKDPVENLVVETYEPKKSCRKCYGTGRIGFIEGDPNKPYWCTCIMKVKKSLKPVVVTNKDAKVTIDSGPTGPQGATNVPQASV